MQINGSGVGGWSRNWGDEVGSPHVTLIRRHERRSIVLSILSFEARKVEDMFCCAVPCPVIIQLLSG